MAAIDNNTDMVLATMCELLEASAVTVRTILITYHNINFSVTYNLPRLTWLAYQNRNSTDQPFYMAKYIVASVLDWSLVEGDGVTPLPVTFTSLAQLKPTLIAAIGKGLSDDYALVINTVCKNHDAVLNN